MPVAKNTLPQPAAPRKPVRARAATRETTKDGSWREGLQGLVTMVARKDFAMLRKFCPQLTGSPDVVMALHGILLNSRDGDVHNWDGIPEKLLDLSAVVVDHLEAMSEAIDMDDIADPDIEPGAWLQVGMSAEGKTLVHLGWFDLDEDPEVAEYLTYRVVEFDADEAVLAFLLIAEMADFATYTGYVAALN